MSTTEPTKAGPHTVSASEIVASFAEADHQEADLSGYSVEDWICLAFFWTMTILVCVQFFTRYVMNDSVAWTEELAVYCLMPVVFIGSAACVRRSRHIQVNFIYRYLPGSVGRVLATITDVISILFFGYVSWLFARYAMAVDGEPMTTITWSKSDVYWISFAGMFLMTIRAIQVSFLHLKQGYSVLERTEAYD